MVVSRDLPVPQLLVYVELSPLNYNGAFRDVFVLLAKSVTIRGPSCEPNSQLNVLNHC